MRRMELWIRKDMELLIEAEDAINNMDRVLVQLTSMGHSEGMFNKMDNVYEVYNGLIN